MNSSSSKREQAVDACDKVINGIEDGAITISASLLLCKKIARLVNDTEGMKWLEYEHSGYPVDKDGRILHQAWKIGAEHGRVYRTADNNGQHLQVMFPELCGELESLIQSDKAALSNYSTKGFSAAGDSAVLATYKLTSAVAEGTNYLLKNIKIAERHLEILRAQYYDYALKWKVELSFGSVSNTIFEEYREKIDKYFVSLPVTTLQKLNAIEDMMEDGNPERYAQILASCRRLWIEVAELLFNEVLPNYNEVKFRTNSGIEIDVSGEHYNNRLSAVIETLQKKSVKNTLVGSTTVYLIDWMERIIDRQNAGVHSEVTREEAMQCIIHTYIALGDVLRLKNAVSPV